MSDRRRGPGLGDVLLACLFRDERSDWSFDDVACVAQAAAAVDLDPASALNLIVDAGLSTPTHAALAVREAFALTPRIFERTMRRCGYPPAMRRHLLGTAPDA